MELISEFVHTIEVSDTHISFNDKEYHINDIQNMGSFRTSTNLLLIITFYSEQDIVRVFTFNTIIDRDPVDFKFTPSSLDMLKKFGMITGLN